MGSLIAIGAWLAPALIAVFYCLSLYKRIGDRSQSLIATDLLVFPFCYFLFTFVSMAGAYAIGPSVRTPTIGFWLLVLVAWVGLHALRWKPVLKLASLSVFIGMSAILVFVTYMYLLRINDKVWWAAESAAKRSACRSNLSEIGKAMMIYAGENDDRLPVSNWTDSLSKFAKREHFQCPASGDQFSYSMNSEALGVSTFDAAPLFAIAFDGYGGENVTSLGPAKMKWAHGRGTLANVLTIGGGARHVMPYTLFDYIWDRETALSPEWESWLKRFERR